MSPLMLQIIIGIGVIAAVGAVGLVLSKSPSEVAEQRLQGMDTRRKSKADLSSTMLLRPDTMDQRLGGLLKVLPSPESLKQLYEQADVDIPFSRFMMVPVVLVVVGGVLGLVARIPLPAVPVVALILGAMPFFWLVMRKKKRIKQ